MAQIVITLRVTPSSPEINLDELKPRLLQAIMDYSQNKNEHNIRYEEKPFAFGLKNIEIIFVMDEKLGDMDELESHVKKVHGVQGVEVIDMRRAIG